MRVVYESQGQVCVLISCSTELSIRETAEKDVPLGIPFWIVSETDLPTDQSARDAWVLDTDVLGEPDGYGSRV